MRNDVRANGACRWVSIRVYCARYDLDRKTVYKYLEAGLLESWQVGRVLRVEDRPPAAITTRHARG